MMDQRFVLAMAQISGKRLTYNELTGKSDSPHHETTGTRQAQASSLSPFLVLRKVTQGQSFLIKLERE